jgi:tRNA-(ms[2]io[6]A)-hydroxylase
MSAAGGGPGARRPRVDYPAVAADLPPLHPTPRAWAELAAAQLPEFLADHAACERQVANYALSLVALYPDDAELADQVAGLAAEEVHHLRRVLAILHRRGLPAAGRRPNRWAQALRARIELGREPLTKVDRLLFGALVEARSCERFTRLLEVLDDAEVERLLWDLGPAERRHWELFHRLAARELPPEGLAERWRGWLAAELELALRAGTAPTVHG